MIVSRSARLLLFATVSSCAAPAAVASPQKREPSTAAILSSVRIEVRNVERARGKIVVALYDTPPRFPERDAAARSLRVPVTGDPTVVRIDAVPVGEYAAVLYQDLDDDGALDRSFVGYPTEPFGFSNDASLALFGPPSFEDCAFRVGREPVTLQVHLR